MWELMNGNKMKKLRNAFTICLVMASLTAAQRPAASAGQTSQADAQAAAAAQPGAALVRENYSKYEYRIPMRDGVKLFTSVYIPKDVIAEGKTYPILLQRTPYNVAPYGADKYRATLGPSELFAREKFIFAYQDVRGRFMSEGDFTIIRPHKPAKGPKDTDESTDCYDTVEWLVNNIAGNTGKVGMWGVSQPGFFAAAGMIDAHPALVAVSPQAPVTDYYLNDDSYHNGAFMLAPAFASIRASGNARETPRRLRPRWPSTTARRTATSSTSTWVRWLTQTRGTSNTVSSFGRRISSTQPTTNSGRLDRSGDT